MVSSLFFYPNKALFCWRCWVCRRSAAAFTGRCGLRRGSRLCRGCGFRRLCRGGRLCRRCGFRRLRRGGRLRGGRGFRGRLGVAACVAIRSGIIRVVGFVIRLGVLFFVLLGVLLLVRLCLTGCRSGSVRRAAVQPAHNGCAANHEQEQNNNAEQKGEDGDLTPLSLFAAPPSGRRGRRCRRLRRRRRGVQDQWVI